MSGRRINTFLVAPAVLFGVGVALHLATPLVAPDLSRQFDDRHLFRPWAGWTSTYMAAHPVWFGLVFTAGYLWLRTRGGVGPGWRGGLEYGAGVFLVGSLPVYMLAFASFQVSPEVVTLWLVQSACQYLAAGAAVG